MAVQRRGEGLPLFSASGATSRLFRTGRTTWTFSRKKPLGAIGAIIILGMILLAIFPGQIAPYEPNDFTGERYATPGATTPSGLTLLGTDELQRDILSRAIWGARISVRIGLISVFVGVTAGLIIGAVAGYLGGLLDLTVQRAVDAMLAFPGLILALFWVTLLQPGANTVTLAIAVTLVAPTTRVLRSSVLSIKEMTYVDGARALGCTTPRILIHHIFPNITALYIILISLSIGNAIIVEASLTFLGLGIAPDIPTWGNMVHRGTRNLFLVGWWLPVVPSVAIALCVYGFNMLGDALRDLWDPRLRGT